MHRQGKPSIQQKKNKIILRQEQIMEISKKKKLLTNFRKSAPFNILGGKSNGMKITGKKFSKHFDTPIKFKGVLFQKNYLEKIFSIILFCHYKFLKIKVHVAEHSFQEPKPNSSLLLNHLYFGARFFSRVKVNHRILYSRILAKMCAVAMATGLVKNKA